MKQRIAREAEGSFVRLSRSSLFEVELEAVGFPLRSSLLGNEVVAKAACSDMFSFGCYFACLMRLSEIAAPNTIQSLELGCCDEVTADVSPMRKARH